jgi:uncharacterized protein YyaL (SSP411 family)
MARIRGALLLVPSVALGACRSSSPGDPAARATDAASQAMPFAPLPGAPHFDRGLSARLAGAWQARPPGYVARTRHVRSDGSPKYVNRLFLEASPYLRQHAHNPVNWFPWGDEAFDLARRLGRPVLLSVGYATCHWCHVMEEESFEDEEVARAINEGYVPIKVDREERPDVDGVYMAAVEALTGGGGWPMTVWLTPDRRPFAGGTYLPPHDGDRGARTGLLTLLRERQRLFAERPGEVDAAATDLSRRVSPSAESIPPAPSPAETSWSPDPRVLRVAEGEYERRFDPVHGGLVGAPKFPSSLPLRFLLRYHRRTGDDGSLRMATLTLDQMAAGGIHDHVGGGFHRYATDSAWRVPHFEKMLYDNALLTLAYLDAFQATGRADFAAIAREVLDYAAREMTSPEGAFYAASDADSPGPDGRLAEGRFFTWTPAEIEGAVGRDRAPLLEAYFGVGSGALVDGRSVLARTRPLPDVARGLGLDPDLARAEIDEEVRRMRAARSEREPPSRDEEVLASYDGLMIRAFAQAALVLGDDRYARAGVAAADFVLTRMRSGERLVHSFAAGRSGKTAYLDDYAFMTAGLLALYQATSDVRWLREAIALDTVVARAFEDAAGGYYLTPADAQTPLARQRPSYDGAEPSGASVEVLDLLELHALTARDDYRARAERALRSLENQLARAPTSLSELLSAVDFATDRAKTIVLACPTAIREAEPLLRQVRAIYLPNSVLVRVVDGDDARRQAALASSAEGKTSRGGKAVAYVCEGQACRLPTSDPAALAAQLRATVPLAR